MNIDLSNFINKGESTYHFEGEIPGDVLELENDDLRTLLDVKYKGSIFKVEDSYSLVLDIFYKYKAKCARCLTEVEEELGTRVQGDLVSSDTSTNDQDHNMIFLKNHSLEIEELVISEVNSSIPMRVICDENCKGLCLKCGIDLNKSGCDCDFEYYDPRLEKLRDLFSNDEEVF